MRHDDAGQPEGNHVDVHFVLGSLTGASTSAWRMILLPTNWRSAGRANRMITRACKSVLDLTGTIVDGGLGLVLLGPLQDKHGAHLTDGARGIQVLFQPRRLKRTSYEVREGRAEQWFPGRSERIRHRLVVIDDPGPPCPARESRPG
jgi:hypothetical protein